MAEDMELLRRIFHRMICGRYEVTDTGRYLFRPDYTPEFGSEDCECKGRTVKVNGVPYTL